MAKLDKSKPFGTICGVFGSARFEQDGHYFDASGVLLDNEGNPLKASNANPPTPAQNTGGGDDSEKDALIAEAKELGIPATKNWGLAKLNEEIQKAKALSAAPANAPAEGEPVNAQTGEPASDADSQLQAQLGAQ